MISLIAKLRKYILGTVRMSLLHVIIMIMMILPVVPNIKKTADTGNSYCLKELTNFINSYIFASVSPFASVYLSLISVQL